MKQVKHAAIKCVIALSVFSLANGCGCGCGCGCGFAQSVTQQQARRDNGRSMARPPETASGGAHTDDPDNMPIKRPNKATNDRMTHKLPASAAIAK
jgi:hypothetical protein